jgi:pimeloyl-ACP methyl ester carboxylesterase
VQDMAGPGASVQGEERWVSGEDTALRLVAYAGAGPGGPSVVVLHGLGTGVDVLREAVPGLDPFARLAAEGLNVLALDWPGHGRSGGRRGHLTYRQAMESAALAVGEARALWNGEVGLLGTGLGGVLAFYAALEDDRVGAVACHNAIDLRDVRPVLRRARQGVLLPAAARLRRVLSSRLQERTPIPTDAVIAPADLAADPALTRRLRRHPQAVRRYDLASLASILLTPEDKPAVEAQRVATFVAVGGADRVLPETAARALVARLSCPAQLWALPGGSHQLLLEHPAAFAPQAAAFLHEHLRTRQGA